MARLAMKKLASWMCAALLAFAMVPAIAPAAQAHAAEAEELSSEVAVPGEVIVVYADGTDLADIIARSGVNAESAKVIAEGAAGENALAKIVLADEAQTADAIASLNALPGVEAQANYRYQLIDDTEDEPESAADGALRLLSKGTEGLSQFSTSSTNDPKYSQCYYLLPWSDTSGATCGANLEAAWEEVTGDMMPAVVAVFDTGCRIDHEDLDGIIDTEHMAYVSEEDATWIVPGAMKDVSPTYHGTHVCGTVGAIVNNGVGIAGASHNARVLPIRVFNESNGCTTDTLLAAMQYIEGLVASGEVPNLHVVNMSLTGYETPKETDRALQREIGLLRTRYHVMTVCAAGNDTTTAPGYPGDYPEAVAVTSLTKLGGNLASSDYNLAKDISAPGQGIISTMGTTASSYGSKNGTSMASPIVASIAALLWTVNPDLTVDQALEAMQKTAHSLENKPNYYTPQQTGSPGAVDALAAVQYVQEHYPSTSVLLSKVEAAPIEAQLYTGAAIEPEVSLTYEGEALVAGEDFVVVDCKDNVEEGTATIVLNGIGDFKGEKRLTFEIVPNLGSSRAQIKPIAAQEYSGEEIEPIPVVSYNGVTLRYGTDFDLSYEDNITGPVGCVIITGKGAYHGVARAYFAIEGGPDEEAVERVTAIIRALPDPADVTRGDAEQIGIAQLAVEGLTETQRAMMDTADLARYEQVVAAFEALKAQVMRIAGDYANETSAKISAEAFESSEWVVLARDDDFADALGATGVAGALGCPIVLTDRTGLSPAAAVEIARLGAKSVYIIGGTGAMAPQLETDLAALGVTFIDRLWGEASYDTSLACAQKVVDLGGKKDEAIIAMSTNFQDALSMSSYAYKYKVPVVLQTWGATSADRGFTPGAAEWLAGKSLLVAGGAGAISNASVAAYTVTERLWGETGYDTSQRIAEWMCAKGYLEPTTVVLACGAQAPKGTDALAGAALAGKLSAPVLLVTTNADIESPNTTTIDGFLTTNKDSVQMAYVLGGTYVMPSDLYTRITSLLGVTG